MADSSGETDVSEGVLCALMDHIASPGFQTKFESFFREHCGGFAAVDSAGGTGDLGELKHEYTAVYERFTAMFEESLAEFLDRHNITGAQLYKHCKDLVRRGNEEAAGYIELFLASTEFSSFVWLMRHVLAEQQRDAANAKRAAESSESKGDDWAKARDAPDEDGGRGPARVAEMDDIAGGAGDSSETTDSARRKK